MRPLQAPGNGEPSECFGWRAESCAVQAPCTDSEGFHITVFELSYQQRDGWNAAEHCWLWAAGESLQQVEQDFHGEHID
jgi:hypothetical protein